ncbi:HNH endonuclease [Pseudomonas sp. BGr12]|uniref:HNH endonuclease n=1 Tax=Pseudomonas sp. BGr12 TaxID=2936269 RepID=UPI00255A1854|nr:HNH endonuclease domain-containing protein [Pseudomonas sp. BJa5]MDL2427652.1 DUF1524 domain-containing protein [Pseudomonas sp. BJa5]
MLLFESLAFADTDQQLLDSVRAHRGKAWSSNRDIKKLRVRLLTLQNYRCAYCQSHIELDELGHRELDHILPKSPTKECTEQKGRSNSFNDRRHTFGYSQFTFEPYNLIIACKPCNSSKGSFDPLLDRTPTAPLADYPHPDGLLWFYPYKHSYSDHIERSEHWLYSEITPQGEAVIKACGLDKAEVLASRFANRAMIRAKHAGDLRTAVTSLASDVRIGKYSFDHASAALVDTLKTSIDHAVAMLNLQLEVLEGAGFEVMVKIEALFTTVIESNDVDTAAAARAIDHAVADLEAIRA